MKSKEYLTINIRGRILDFRKPWIMGILNVTPDSFFRGSRALSEEEIKDLILRIRDEGADCIDIGACSTRPGADPVPAEEEWDRVCLPLALTRELWPEAIISVDTFRADVARKSVKAGADIINDISGGTLDSDMFRTVAQLKVPYVLMHMRGTPATMDSLTTYDDVTADVLTDLAFKIRELRKLGVCDIIVDPGFGFSKTVEQNYELMANLEQFTRIGLPVLVGISRKSLVWRPLSITPEEALPGTITLNTFALMHGASVIRVHDVAAAVQSRSVLSMLNNSPITR